MAKRSIMIIGIILALGILAAGQAAARKTAALTASGKVKSLSQQAGQMQTLVVKTDQGQEVMLQVDAKKTAVTKDHRLAAVSQVRAGDLVRVNYEVRRGKNYAKALDVTTPPAPKPAAKSKAKSSATTTKSTKR